MKSLYFPPHKIFMNTWDRLYKCKVLVEVSPWVLDLTSWSALRSCSLTYHKSAFMATFTWWMWIWYMCCPAPTADSHSRTQSSACLNHPWTWVLLYGPEDQGSKGFANSRNSILFILKFLKFLSLQFPSLSSFFFSVPLPRLKGWYSCATEYLMIGHDKFKAWTREVKDKSAISDICSQSMGTSGPWESSLNLDTEVQPGQTLSSQAALWLTLQPLKARRQGGIPR